MAARDHEPTTPAHCTSDSPHAPARAFARHRLHGVGGVRFLHDGRAHEALVRPLWAAASLLSALRVLLAVSAAAHRLAAVLAGPASDEPALASVSRRARHSHAGEFRIRRSPSEPRADLLRIPGGAAADDCLVGPPARRDGHPKTL